MNVGDNKGDVVYLFQDRRNQRRTDRVVEWPRLVPHGRGREFALSTLSKIISARPASRDE